MPFNVERMLELEKKTLFWDPSQYNNGSSMNAKTIDRMTVMDQDIHQHIHYKGKNIPLSERNLGITTLTRWLK